MRRSTATPLLLLLGALAALQGCGDAAEPLPAVSWIEVTPPDTLLAPGDSARFTATAYGVDGSALGSVPLTFALEPGSPGELTDDGLFRATGEGEARIVVTEPRGVRAFAHVRTSTVTAFSPANAPFGGLVEVRGAGFGPLTEVVFNGAPGVVKSVAPDGRSLEAWVPWDAGVGPIDVLPDGERSVRAPGTFYLTGGGDDALEPNDLARATPVELPFRNPFLLTRWDDMDQVSFEVTRPVAITLRAVDRGAEPAWSERITLQLNQGDAGEEFLGITNAFDYVGDRRTPAVVSRARLEPGRYTARVFVPETLERRYALEIDTVPSFAVAPDIFEENDFPAEAPEVVLPLSDTLAIENPWGVDYYTLRITQRSSIRITATSFGPRLAIFLIDGDRSVHWHLANGTRAHTWRGAISPERVQTLVCRVEPGDYHVGVLENGGEAGTYALDVTAEPSSTGFLNCLSGPAGMRAPEPALLAAPPGR